ncbi:zinc ribbon domain-containing protein [Rickettsiella endosymbiont of Miltochrista miniata]|uniref:FmdB family zinc ribbon protein n=1 Tax=Rickettsiella endosymbiont of Miltochrista miniata TaxID=3066239 RepID=UPI00313C6678
MPIYEYQCKACGHTFDTIQSFSEEPLTDCPVCKEPALKKLISASAFHLKGSGWYVTDFKNPPAKKDNSEKTKTEDATSKPVEANKEPGKEAKTKETAAAKPADKTSKADKSDEKSS